MLIIPNANIAFGTFAGWQSIILTRKKFYNN